MSSMTDVAQITKWRQASKDENYEIQYVDGTKKYISWIQTQPSIGKCLLNTNHESIIKCNLHVLT